MALMAEVGGGLKKDQNSRLRYKRHQVEAGIIFWTRILGNKVETPLLCQKAFK